MGLRHDATAWVRGLARPTYGEEVLFEGRDLPKPRRIKVPTRHGAVTCLDYPGTIDGAAYVHFHGGAFMMRHPEMDDFWARFVVATTGVRTLLPDYLVAPRVRYPVAHEQAHDVCAAVARDVARVVVGGFSGGGGLAASAALQARDSGLTRLAGQLLGVPSLDVAEDIAAKVVPGSMIGEPLLRLVRATYFRDAARRGEAYASPLLAPDVSGLPPAMIVTAARDSLRAEGDGYATRLTQAGVDVRHQVAPRVDHYFLHGAGPAQARRLMDAMAAFVGECTG